jgi:RimJ/RimL family protein N-acetyltransferase
MQELVNRPPLLETERLALRPPRMEDAEDIFRTYATDEEVTRYVIWRPHRSIEETREFLRTTLDFPADGSRLSWAITFKGDDRVRGMIELRVDRFKADAGYVLAREFWGRGYTTEALAAVIRFAFTLPGIYRVWALCDAENIASARVMEKAGMSFEGVLRRYVLHPAVSPEPRDARCYAVVR